MEAKQKIRLLEEMLELDEGCLSIDTDLNDLEEWDSLAKISLVVLAKTKFGKILRVTEIKSFLTVGDIINYL